MNSDGISVVTERALDGRMIVRLIGEFDVATVGMIAEAIDSTPAHTGLILDLTATTFADSTVLAEFLRARGRAQGVGADPVVLVIPEGSPVEMILTISGTMRLFRRYMSLEAAQVEFES